MSASSSNTLSPLHSTEDSVHTMRHHSLSIPPELIDEIIDYLWDDKDALIACSFVCRLFYLRTRAHLLHSIELKHTPDDSVSQSILPYIKNITICRGASPILSLTPFLSSLPNLTTLHLDRLQFPDPWSLHHLICQIPRLTSLDLSAIRFRQDFLVELGSVGSGLLPKINKISMWGTSFHASVVEFLIHRRELRAVYVDSLRGLCIMYPPGEYLSLICAFVRAARSLRSLDIRIRETKYRINVMSEWPAQLDVLPLTMPVLKIEIENDYSCWHVKTMRWLLDSLVGANGPIMLEMLTLVVVPPIHLGVFMDDNAWRRQWSRLDEVLTGPDMNVFRRLTVISKPRADYLRLFLSQRLDFIEWVCGKLPLLGARGMLDVDTVEDTNWEDL
ncbi:uncharacterized protein EV420DRAFT_1724165 [Desarmillaria tabescens]|uniref:F-box domain-containing protein n=1 Tax=Armillaria tabescens TaxID=1929756 RepID=A0AA39JJI2_ARMTA|nr:uncharacterized protein EV420DRAFT_1724165 [Desarmillaria tabescens]KAK0443352.1 hypothetical protein EV420DRAFT_1724165 [Desarmillaria tabescens]